MRRRFSVRSERGMALVMAIGIMTVLAITGTTVTYYATSNSSSATRSKTRQSAYALAEAGINTALSVLSASFQPATPTALPSCNTPAGPLSAEGGTYTYCGTLNGSVWTLTSVGKMRNPASPNQYSTYTLNRAVSILGLNNGSSLAAWSRIYNDDATAGTCDGLAIPSGVTITGNVGSKGNICLTGGQILGSTSEVAAGGNVTLTSGSTLNIGPNFPTAASAGWTNPQNVYVDDNVFATNAISGNSNGATVDATGFSLGVPTSAATIVGIVVNVERYASTAGRIVDNTVQLLKNGSPVGSNKASASTWGTSGAGGKGTDVAYGTSTDLWGTTWTPAEVNASNFGLRFQARNSNATATTASLDEVEITVYYTIGPNIGVSGTPVAKADIYGTCKLNSASAHTPCSSADNVYATSITSSPSGLAKPTVDFDYWYNNAAPGPKHGCDVSSGTPPVFDNNSTYDGSAGDQWPAPDPTPKDNPAGSNGGTTGTSTSYTCIAKDAGGNTIGELSWNNATRVLTVKGTIFFDGGAIFHDHNGYVVHYQGRATIYASKGWHNDEAVCAGGSGLTTCRDPNTISNWDPVQNLLVFILGDKDSSGSDDCNFHTDYSAFQGVIWAKNDCSIKETAYVSAPVLANVVDITGTPTFFAWPNLGSLLPGQQYGSTSTSTDFLISPGDQSG